jgi:hypothetical protein
MHCVVVAYRVERDAPHGHGEQRGGSHTRREMAQHGEPPLRDRRQLWQTLLMFVLVLVLVLVVMVADEVRVDGARQREAQRLSIAHRRRRIAVRRHRRCCR